MADGAAHSQIPPPPKLIVLLGSRTPCLVLQPSSAVQLLRAVCNVPCVLSMLAACLPLRQPMLLQKRLLRRPLKLGVPIVSVLLLVKMLGDSAYRLRACRR